MYQLTSAVAKPLAGTGRWISVEIGNVALRVLFSTYSRVIATLTNPFLPEPVALDLNDIRPGLEGSALTFNEFLTQNGASTLPTSNTLPVLKDRYAKYADAFHAGYKVRPIHETAALDAQMPPSEKKWLHLSRDDTDYELFYKSCLVNVNGYFHLTDYDTSGVYVKDGMKSAMVSGKNQIGIVSFADLGQLSFVPITAENMVYKQNERQSYKHRAYVDLGQDVANKTVMLVLGGYLHVLDRRTMTRVGASMVCIDFENLNLLDRYFESKQFIDLSSLPLSKTNRNLDQISISEFYSDANILAYLTLSQSFFVILDNADVFAEISHLPPTRIVDIYVTDETPIYPMMIGAGRLANYWAMPEEGKFAVVTTGAVKPNPIYDTIDPTKENSVSNQCDPEQPYVCSPAYFLKVGSSLS
jgi:hypothetical protein